MILFELVIFFFSFSFVVSSTSTEAPRLIDLAKSQRQILGSTFALTCNPWSGSPPFIYSFYKNGVYLKSSNSRLTITEMKDSLAMLMVKNLTTTDSGNYSCTVQNRGGSDAKWTMLQVNGLFLFLLESSLKMWRYGVRFRSVIASLFFVCIRAFLF